MYSWIDNYKERDGHIYRGGSAIGIDEIPAKPLQNHDYNVHALRYIDVIINDDVYNDWVDYFTPDEEI